MYGLRFVIDELGAGNKLKGPGPELIHDLRPTIDDIDFRLATTD